MDVSKFRDGHWECGRILPVSASLTVRLSLNGAATMSRRPSPLTSAIKGVDAKGA